MADTPCPDCSMVHGALPCALTLDAARLDNAVLRRLVAEVQEEHHHRAAYQRGYDRIHNRHNRNHGERSSAPAAPQEEDGHA